MLQRWRGTRRSRTPLDKVPVCVLRRSEGCVEVLDPLYKVPVCALRRSEGCVEVPDSSRGEVRDSGCVC